MSVSWEKLYVKCFGAAEMVHLSWALVQTWGPQFRSRYSCWKPGMTPGVPIKVLGCKEEERGTPMACWLPTWLKKTRTPSLGRDPASKRIRCGDRTPDAFLWPLNTYMWAHTSHTYRCTHTHKLYVYVNTAAGVSETHTSFWAFCFCLPSLHRSTVITDVLKLCVWFYLSPGDLNLGFCTYIASAFIHRATPWSQTINKLLID